MPSLSIYVVKIGVFGPKKNESPDSFYLKTDDKTPTSTSFARKWESYRQLAFSHPPTWRIGRSNDVLITLETPSNLV